MKERPSWPLKDWEVCAILEGWKTLKRIAVKHLHPDCYQDFVRAEDGYFGWRDQFGRFMQAFPCPYGQPGDRLWVREAWQGPLLDEGQREEYRQDGPDAFKTPAYCTYRATDTLDAIDDDGNELGWCPSIHMPRWASRILLEVTAVRVERLQDISEEDSWAEGIDAVDGVFDEQVPAMAKRNGGSIEDARTLYACLWESINGAGSWASNPWVWVVEFKRIT